MQSFCDFLNPNHSDTTNLNQQQNLFYMQIGREVFILRPIFKFNFLERYQIVQRVQTFPARNDASIQQTQTNQPQPSPENISYLNQSNSNMYHQTSNTFNQLENTVSFVQPQFLQSFLFNQFFEAFNSQYTNIHQHQQQQQQNQIFEQNQQLVDDRYESSNDTLDQSEYSQQKKSNEANDEKAALMASQIDYSDDKIIRCEVCNKNFYGKTCWLRHVKKAHSQIEKDVIKYHFLKLDLMKKGSKFSHLGQRGKKPKKMNSHQIRVKQEIDEIIEPEMKKSKANEITIQEMVNEQLTSSRLMNENTFQDNDHELDIYEDVFETDKLSLDQENDVNIEVNNELEQKEKQD